MKTVKDLEDMRNIPCAQLENQYNYLFSYLTDCYILKADGLTLIQKSLNEWDDEAKKIIVHKLIDILLGCGLNGFDSSQIINLM